MKANYKNWVPRGLLFLFSSMAIICLAVCAVFGIAGVATDGGLRIVLGVLFGAAFLLFAALTGIFANIEYSAPVEHPGRLKLNTLVAFG